jgi:hypothetical protein
LAIIVIKKRGEKLPFCIDSMSIVSQSRVHDKKKEVEEKYPPK